MNHIDAVRLNATERYILKELDPAQLDQFEEHVFDCQECALDLRAATVFLEHSKSILAKSQIPEVSRLPVPVPTQKHWLSWLRPAIAVPVMAGLLAVIGFQNLVTFPRMQSALHQPQVMPWASVTVGTYGANGPTVTAAPGQGFLLFVRIPPEAGFERYTADLYNPAGTLEWSLTFPATTGQDQWPMQVPAANRAAGTYRLAIHGIIATGESKDLGQASFELQIKK